MDSFKLSLKKKHGHQFSKSIGRIAETFKHNFRNRLMRQDFKLKSLIIKR